MARGINKVTIIGNLGQDPESRTFPDGGTVTNISVATSESWKDKQTGEERSHTEWHRIVFRNRLAEIAAQYLRKGAKVYIEGKLSTRKWTNQQGQDQYTTEIMATQMQMLDSQGNGDPGYVPPQAAPQYQQPAPVPQAQPLAAQPMPQATAAPSPNAALPPIDDFDDDIPFN